MDFDVVIVEFSSTLPYNKMREFFENLYLGAPHGVLPCGAFGLRRRTTSSYSTTRCVLFRRDQIR